MTVRHELEAWLEAWLGDDHGLTTDQLGDLLTLANDIHARYPDQGDEDERQAALIVAYQLLLDQDRVLELVDEMARKLVRARASEAAALAGLRQAALTVIRPGGASEAGFARRAGLDRMAVRAWLGKR